MRTLLPYLAAAALMGACATGPETGIDNSNANARPEREFTTGSNLPRRNRMGGDPVNVMTPEEFERSRAAAGQGTGDAAAPR